MKHRPNILVCDMAHMVAGVGNRFEVDFFSPNQGRILEVTAANVELAKSGKLSVLFPFLEDNTPAKCTLSGLDSHPVTGSNIQLALFDTFHQGNTKSEVESLRRIGCIKELKGILNSQVAEQLHHSFNKNKHVLNQMKPVNHIFMFLSLIDLHNDTKNINICSKKNDLTAAALAFNEFGRGYLWTNEVGRMLHEIDLEVKEDSDGNDSDSNASDSLSSDTYEKLAITAPDPCELDSLSESSPSKKKRAKAIVSTPLLDLKRETEDSRIWIEELGLTYADKNLIESGCNLNAAIIDASLKVIRKENNAIEGLQPVVETGNFKGNSKY